MKLLDVLNDPERLLARLTRDHALTPADATALRSRVVVYCAVLNVWCAKREGFEALTDRPDVQRNQRQRKSRRLRRHGLQMLADAVSSRDTWTAATEAKARWLREVAAKANVGRRLRAELLALLTDDRRLVTTKDGRKITIDLLERGRRLLRHLRARGAVTTRVKQLLTPWKRQWKALEAAMQKGRVLRCRQPDCGIEGGRFFVARGRFPEVDCPYCVRKTPNHTQRYRNAQKRGTLSPAVHAINSNRRIVQSAERARRARLRLACDASAREDAANIVVSFEPPARAAK